MYGDAVAIVCADTEAHAKAAAAAVKVELEELPAYMSAPAAMAEDAMEIHPGVPNVYFTQKIKKGEETGPIFGKADVVVEDEFYVGRQPHMPMEPDVGFAYQNDEGKLCIHSKSVGLHPARGHDRSWPGVELENLVMVQNPAGGTFGYKISPTMEALVGAACLATGRPVFLNYNYHQQMTYTPKRSPFWMKIKMAADKEGKLLGMETDWSVDHGPYSEFGDGLTLRGAQFMGAGYDIPAIRGEGRNVCTNHSWGAAFRAYGAPQAEFSSEVLMDELAEKLGMDPLELRFKNAYRPGSTTPTGQEPEVYLCPRCWISCDPSIKRPLKRPRPNSDRQNQARRGHRHRHLRLRPGRPGRLRGARGAQPGWHGHHVQYLGGPRPGRGHGLLGTAHQALRPLGLKPEQIKLVMNDTSKSPDSGPAGGSRSQVMTGQAIKNGLRAFNHRHEEG